LKVTTEQIDECVTKVVVEIDDERIKPALEKAARQASRRFQIPGFRKGRAPYSVVARLVGEEYLRREAVEEIGPDVIEEALRQQEIEPYATPELVDLELDPLRLTVTVPLEPKVELGDYRSIHIEREEVEITDEDVERALEELREEHALYEPVDRPLEVGDVATGELSVRFVDDMEGEPVYEDDDFRVKVSDAGEAMAFELPERLVGAKIGDVLEYEMTLPADYPDESGAGKEVHVRFEVRNAEDTILPELEELPVMVGDYDDLEQLTAELRDRLETEAKEQAETKLREEALAALVEQATIQYPPVAVETKIDSLMEELRENLASRRISMEAFLKASGTTEEQLREELRPRAERELQEGLAMRAFVEAEGIEVTDEELRGRVDQTVTNIGEEIPYLVRYLQSDEGMRMMRASMLSGRAMRRLISIVTGEPEPPEPELPLEEMPAPPVTVVERAEEDDESVEETGGTQ